MSDDFNLYPLHVFRLVAQHGSVTRAAQELFISQPAVSAHLRTIEAKYGESLFERTPRGMTLTAAGEIVNEHAGRLFALYDGVTTALDEVRGKVRGEVAIAASSTPAAYLVPQLLKNFQMKYPEARPILKVGDSGEVLAWLHDFRVPIGVVGEMANTDDLEQVAIGADELQLVVAANDSLTKVKEIKPENVAQKTLFLRKSGSSTRAAAVELLGDLSKAFERIVEVNSTEAIKQSVAAGLGVAVLSSWSTKLEVQAGLLRPIKNSKLHHERKFYVVKRKDRKLTGSAAAMWDLFVKSS